MKSRINNAFFLCVFVGITSLNSVSFKVMSAQQANVNAGNKVIVQTEVTGLVAFVNDPEAKTKLRQLLGQFNQLQAQFSQRITDMQGEILQESNGQIFIEKPHKLRWSVRSPEASLLIADGKTVFNIDPFVEQVTLIEQAELTANNPLMLLVSDQESQWQSVNIQQNDDGFLLRPIDINAPITDVVLTFDTQQTLLRLTSIDRQQQKNVITFTGVVTNTLIPVGLFAFEAPEGWVIDDQRTLN